MLLKKIALIGTTLGVLALPALASAALDLHTINHTPYDSTVRVNGTCSGPIESGVTRSGKDLHTYQGAIRLICRKIKGECTADLYASDDCSGNSIGTITLIVDNVTIKQPATMTDPHYTVSYVNHVNPGQGGTDVIIDYHG